MKKYLVWISLMVLLFTACGKKPEPVKEEVVVEVNETVEVAVEEEVIPALTVYDWQQNDELIKAGKAVKMVVVKGKRVLVLFDKEAEVLSRHRISLGENPVGRKLKMGDKKTPEGRYGIRDIRKDKKYYKEILINYPNKEDRQRSKALGFNPGGGITFHAQVPWNWNGSSDDYTLSNDWTNGCIALTNHGMDMVLKMIDKNTIVEIEE
ncbi:MAG: ErfK/YbiS/YcfS/YnhG family protein [uncultured Sulfurovum sp.]|uniref:ErfK/YbiS/YcfS/YnhG family protein n=1 Tax=uncultured Sulfurovum sp. TaxID=269237 RepID=A0A6S6SS31_9BACT|nr:MAG: ErfK/YbiS/YcfS/YnhG family protein [uncultured Sulfurovum sp.]